MLIFHIIAGGLVLLSGLVALLASKGLSTHRQAGNIFFTAMVVLSLSAIYLELQLEDFPIMGVLSLYFVTTSWLTVKRPERTTGYFEMIAFLTVSVIAITFYKWGWDIAYNGKVLEGTLPLAMYFIWGSFAAFAALLDLNMMIRGGLAGSHRIARHLWRMCISLIMGTMSFLSQDIFPAIIANTGLLWSPIIVLLLMMIYWLCRLPFTQWNKDRVV